MILSADTELLKEIIPAGKTPPTLTFIVVGKRHHVRFFPKSNHDADNSGNCLPGLIVDRDIVHPIEYDFYLQSHAGLLGSRYILVQRCKPPTHLIALASRSGHYTVIHDENRDIPADAMQLISIIYVS